MQKKLLTIAVAGALAAPAVAMAQVTVFGTIDTGVRSQSKAAVGAAGATLTPGTTGSVLLVTDGLRTTNRWGLRGSEDLGGGLMANFWLEGQYSSDTGLNPASGTVDASSTSTAAALKVTGGLFQRKAVVGLSKGGNSVDLGRDYTVNFKMMGIMDPMSFTYTGLTPTAGATFTAGTRSDNLVTAGFRFGTGGIRVDYAAGEIADENGGNSRMGFGGDFAFGPATVVFAYSTQANAADTQDTTTMNVGGAYKMGAFTFRGGWNTQEIDSGNESTMYMLGAQYAFSPTWNGRVAYYNTTIDNAAGTEIGSRKLMIAAVDYILSKRTSIYFAFDRHTMDGNQIGAAIQGYQSDDGSTGISAGVAHSF
jgi:predicted porin